MQAIHTTYVSASPHRLEIIERKLAEAAKVALEAKYLFDAAIPKK